MSRLKSASKLAVIHWLVSVSVRRHMRDGVFRTVMLVYLARLGSWLEPRPSPLQGDSGVQRTLETSSCIESDERTQHHFRLKAMEVSNHAFL